MKTTSLINNILDATLGLNIKKSSRQKWTNSAPVGMVEQYDRKKIVGWVSADPKDFPIKLELCINGTPVTSTWADVAIEHTTNGELRSFYIATRDVWKYCKEKYHLTVQIDDQILPVNEMGVYRQPDKNGAKTLRDLKKLLTDGYVFDNYGKLQLSKKIDTEWQKKIMDIYNDVSKILRDKYKITPFLIYGSLLGQVREGGFIGHDGDFDIAYVSEHTDGRKAAMGLKTIALALIEAGFDVSQRKTAIHIHSRKEPELKIDLFHLFFNEDHELSFPYGIAGTSQFTQDDWQGTTEELFAGFPVTIPKNAEKLVEYMYGSSWRIPIAGFNWKHARTKKVKSGYVLEEEREEVNSKSALASK